MNARDAALAESSERICGAGNPDSTETAKSAWRRKWAGLVSLALLIQLPLPAATIPVFVDFIQAEIDKTSAGGTVILPAGVFLDNAEVCKDITIRGAGAHNTIIDGNAAGSVFRICSGSTVTLDSLTIRNGLGSEGSGIWNAGTLTLRSVVVASNYLADGPRGAAGLFNSGTAHLEDCILRNNKTDLGALFSGGIYNIGTMRVERTLISSNYSEAPGGINNAGSMILEDTTITSNVGHGIGGIGNTGQMALQNCTVFDNSSEGAGGIANWGVMALTNCTVSRNDGAETGGISSGGAGSRLTLKFCTVYSNRCWGIGFAAGITHIEGVAELRNTIIASNLPGTASGPNLSGSFVSLGHNLIGLNAPTGSADTFTLTGDTASNILGQDPFLGPLQDNGGHTWTHALRPGSPAIDAGANTSIPATDQRGMKRPQDGDGNWIALPDLGAFEKKDAVGHYIAGVRLTPAGEMQFQVRGVAERWYTILAATNVPSQTWIMLKSEYSGTTGFYEVSDSEWHNYPTRFYRVLEQ